MAGNDQDLQNENWKMLRDKAVARMMDLLAAQADLTAQIEAQQNLIALFEALLKPPE